MILARVARETALAAKNPEMNREHAEHEGDERRDEGIVKSMGGARPEKMSIVRDSVRRVPHGRCRVSRARGFGRIGPI